jgi:phospholipid/cholesterol/gamma-HCH transport system substrate-binding protein
METRARYVLVGLFTLAVILAGFGFVYWLHHGGGLRERTAYRINFENGVAGLRAGSAVLFNGINVGEVSRLALSADNPRQVIATIDIDKNTPVRADTKVWVDVQGLLGAPSISLRGGSSTEPAAKGSDGGPPVLTADPGAAQDLTQAARDALRRLDTLLAENSQPLHDTIANLRTFTDALARNSERVDAIVEGLARMTAPGPTKTTAAVYDLTAPRNFNAPERPPHRQLVIVEPTAAIILDTQKILVIPGDDGHRSLDNAQWADNLPKLVHAKITQSFENAQYMSAVSRPTEGLAGDYRLLIDIRSFQISTSADKMADVEFSAKMLAEDGRIVRARLFHATVPAKELATPVAAAALDEAFGKAATELVLWASEVM